jgi:hypothetical protein
VSLDRETRNCLALQTIRSLDRRWRFIEPRETRFHKEGKEGRRENRAFEAGPLFRFAASRERFPRGEFARESTTRIPSEKVFEIAAAFAPEFQSRKLLARSPMRQDRAPPIVSIGIRRKMDIPVDSFQRSADVSGHNGVFRKIRIDRESESPN